MYSSGILQRKIRIISILDAAEKAGLTPLPIGQLHTIAYYSNVLSPVWNMPILEGKILKNQSGPFYPILQNDLDRLVGMGVVFISNVSYREDLSNKWHLDGKYTLNRGFADQILKTVNLFEDEKAFREFLQELVYAFSALSDNNIAQASQQDATYSDPLVDFNDIVDFAEWQNVNYSANAAKKFEHLLPNGTKATRGELLHLFVHHLAWRLQSERSK